LDVVKHLTGLKIVAFDVVEVLPSADNAQITALLAATLVFEFLALIAVDERRSVVAAKGGDRGAKDPGTGARGKRSAGKSRQPVQGGGRRRKAVR